LVPFHCSVAPVTGSLPPAATPAVVVPKPVTANLAVFKSLTSVQLVPFHCSVSAVVGSPPKNKAAVVVPNSLASYLEPGLVKSPTSVQLVPFHCSF